MTQRYAFVLFAILSVMIAGCPEPPPENMGGGGSGTGGSASSTGGAAGHGGMPVTVCGSAAQCPPPTDPLCYEATCDGLCHVDPKVAGSACGVGMVCDGAGTCKPKPPPPDGGACAGCINGMGQCVSGEDYLACGGNGNACEVCSQVPDPCAIHSCTGGVGCTVQWINEGLPCYNTGTCHSGKCVGN